MVCVYTAQSDSGFFCGLNEVFVGSSEKELGKEQMGNVGINDV